jgi:hypothetical protein
MTYPTRRKRYQRRRKTRNVNSYGEGNQMKGGKRRTRRIHRWYKN